jgi:peptidyl-prolyl cis-trans isomerase SurA
MKKNLFFALLMFLLGSTLNLSAQDDPTLITIGGEKITKSEFLSVYQKNNVKKDVLDKKSLEEYLDLYVNFKLKVKEAEAKGMDTVSSFVAELAGYRKQLAQPYLIDKEVNDKLLLEAYNRMQWDIRASHILIKLANDALPKDTLIAYNKIMDIRKKILKGSAFDLMAKENSDDISARDQISPKSGSTIKGNGGDLGYFTVLDLVYPFETMAYNTKVGEVSLPVRTDYGYHLIKVTDRKPAMGKVQVAHILVSVPNDSSGLANADKYKEKIFEISGKLKKGENFEDLAKTYSDDKASAAKGGVIPWFGVSRMVPEFIVAIGDLKKIGDISEPVKTMYGWHIIKLLGRKTIDSLDNVKSELKSRVSKDSRALISKETMVEKLKKEYGFKEDTKTIKDFYKVVNDSIFLGKWNISKAKGLEKPMFTLANKSYTQKDFATYLNENQLNRTKEDSTAYLASMYKKFVEKSIMDYEDSRLEAKYPDFKALMKEYRDGILLFGLTDEMVWSKAVKDTVGLQKYYEANKNNYLWDQRVSADIITCADVKIAKAVRKMIKSGKYSDAQILEKMNKTSQLNLSIVNGKYLKKDNALIDSIPWTVGLTPDIAKNNSIIIVRINKVIDKEPKTLAEARGLITSDYQTYLEKEWITTLKKKYPVEINKDVFSTIK